MPCDNRHCACSSHAGLGHFTLTDDFKSCIIRGEITKQLKLKQSTVDKLVRDIMEKLNYHQRMIDRINEVL